MSITTEYPSAVAKARFVRVSATKARRVIDLVRGKSVTEALRHPAVGAAGRQRAGRQGHRQRCGQRAEQRGAGSVHPRGRHRLRRRGPDRQAHPAARPGACVPNPQAHQPHHGDRREPAVARGARAGRSASAARARRAQGSKAAARRRQPAPQEGDIAHGVQGGCRRLRPRRHLRRRRPPRRRRQRHSQEVR